MIFLTEKNCKFMPFLKTIVVRFKVVQYRYNRITILHK